VHSPSARLGLGDQEPEGVFCHYGYGYASPPPFLPCSPFSSFLGASKPSQIEENVKALQVVERLDDFAMKRIDLVLDNAPKEDFDFGSRRPR